MKQYLSESGCGCGKAHFAAIDDIFIGSGVIRVLPEQVRRYGGRKAFIVADDNTYEAAGKQVCALLRDTNIDYTLYVFAQKELKPDEHSVGSAVMHFDHSCDTVIGVGSGVINDICKILSRTAGKPYIIVATAPSMDGYASSTSSMERDGLKVSLDSRCADVIIGDTDILKTAPKELLQAGIGDMLAKFVSLAEWRIANLLWGEYYCPQVADLVRQALKKCADNASALMRREDAAIEAVFEGLVITGIAMTYAGLSRPASGIEHYFSHLQDMRGLEFGLPTQPHGIQCARGTAVAIRLYDALVKMTPDKKTAEDYVRSFDYTAWAQQLRTFLGKGADAMIALEEKEGKYSPSSHAQRLPVILENWDNILQILQQELPDMQQFYALMDTLWIPCFLDADPQTSQLLFFATKDIRDKYILSRLGWDLGILDQLSKELT